MNLFNKRNTIIKWTDLYLIFKTNILYCYKRIILKGLQEDVSPVLMGSNPQWRNGDAIPSFRHLFYVIIVSIT